MGITTTFAVPANKKPVTIKQPNGKTLTFILQGDERVHWAVTLDGYSLVKNNDGHFVYAQKDASGNMIASNILAANQEERDANDVAFLKTLDKNMQYSAVQVKNFKNLFSPKPKTPTKTQDFFPSIGTKKLLVILVGFSDLDFETNSSVFQNLCSQQNYNGTGSVRDYFLASSGGRLDLDIDVVGPFSLPNTMAYYGSNTDYSASYKFVRDAVNAADSAVDFSQYDNDGDGYVDDLCLIFAGTPESTTGNDDEIWPHSSTLEYWGCPQKDNVRINRYTCSAEKPSPTIGTFVHEFGHALGLPDEYDTDYGTNGSQYTGNAVATGTWSVMCEGLYNNNQQTPALWSAAQKLATGWINVMDTLTTPQDSLRLPLTDTAYRINLTSNEFLIIEQRKQQGFDQYIPGSGMIIYHGQQNKINAWFTNHSNTINVDPNDRGWFIEPADGVDNKVNQLPNHINTSYAPFPGTSNTRYYTATSPNQIKLVNGTAVDSISITSIGYINDSVMIFNFNSSLPMVETDNAVSSATTVSSFTAGGKIVYSKDTNFAAKGLVYSLQSDCPYDTNYVVYDTTSTIDTLISASITGLQPGIMYYYRAFVETNNGVIGLGDIKYVTTSNGLGFVNTQSANNVDSTEATLRGNLIFVGEGSFIEKGFVYTTDENTNPKVDDNVSIKIVVDGSSTGAFTYNLTDLEQGETYYYCAFITNSYGTYYGTKNKFQTKYPDITNNTISGQNTVCLGSTPNIITGENAQGGFGNFTYLWQQKPAYGTWTDASGVNNQASYQPEALSSTTTFRRIATSDNRVESTSNELQITAIQSVGGHITPSTTEYDKNETATLRLSGSTGDVIAWEMTQDTNGTWNNLGNAGNKTLEQTFSESGTFNYRVEVQNEQCPSAYSAIKTINVLASSLNDADNSMVFDIMPNPTTNGKFTITSDIKDAQSIVITNTLGQVIYSEKNVDLTNKTFELKDIEDGSYFISIFSDDKMSTKKLIINK